MLVSVWITTFNHGKFIKQALDSVLMQQTNFDFEIIIGDDYSTDNTREIIESYYLKFPSKLRIYFPDRNLGMHEMFMATYKLCHGEYIAWLDGDDFWTDPFKLQKQVDFLNNNTEFVLCFHKVVVEDEIHNRKYDFDGPEAASDGDTFLLEHLLKGFNPIPSPSVMHRNVLSQILPDWFYKLPYPDFGFYFLLIQHGKFKYLKERMGVYRVHKKGAYQGNDLGNNHFNMIHFFKLLTPHLHTNQKKTIHRIIASYYFKLLEIDLRNKKYKAAKGNVRNIFYYYPLLLIKRRNEIYRLLKTLIHKNNV